MTASGFPQLLLAAFALMLVIEGLLPLLAPDRWRALFSQLLDLKSGQLRFLGLASVALGLLLLSLLL